jgi:hypothetical protein
MVSVYSHSLAGIAGLNPTGNMDDWTCNTVSWQCCVLLGRSLCIRGVLLHVVFKCDCKAFTLRRPWPIRGCWAMGRNTIGLILSGFYRDVHVKFCIVCIECCVHFNKLNYRLRDFFTVGNLIHAMLLWNVTIRWDMYTWTSNLLMPKGHTCFGLVHRPPTET